MRRIALLFAAAALIACGQPATNASADSAPPPPRLEDMAEGAQGGGGGQPIETQTAFVARCTREMIARNPDSRRWAADQCAQQWDTVVAAGPMAETILAVAPGAGERVAASQVRARAGQVQWNARADTGLVAQGRLGESAVQVESAGRVNFFWQQAGAMIPFDVVEALRGRGAEVTMIGCTQLGTGEYNKAYRVVAAGRAPFQLGLYDRTAPTANAESFYNVTLDLSGRVQTIAQLRADGSEWNATCG